MRSIVAVLLAVTLLSACSTRTALIGVGTGLGIAAVGGIVATNPGGDESSEMGAVFVGIDLAVLGGAVVLGSLIGLGLGQLHSAPREQRPWKRNASLDSTGAKPQPAPQPKPAASELAPTK